MSSPAPLRFFFASGYDYGGALPIKSVHGFCLDKPSRIRDGLRKALKLDAGSFIAVEPVTPEQLARVHSERLIADLGRRCGQKGALPGYWCSTWTCTRATETRSHLLKTMKS